MKKRPYFLATVAFLMVAAGSTQAATQTQTTFFNFSGGPFYGTAGTHVGGVPSDFVPSGSFVGTFSPFNSTLGTLNSFTVTWDIYFEATIVAGPGGGSAGIGVNGEMWIGGLLYSGDGNGGGDGGPEGSVWTPNFTVYNSQTFDANAFPGYLDIGILNTILGSTDFDILWDSAYFTNHSNTNPVTGTAVGDLTLIYDFTPAPVPVPAAVWLLGSGLAGLGLFGRRRKRR